MKDYFLYLPDECATTPWECAATAIGYTRVLPGAGYPPQRHPVDHHFSWSKGRILDAYQIVFITEGQGWFESGVPRRRYAISAGTVFLLFPKIWHRYLPGSSTGWVEHWVECRGPAFDRARKLRLLDPAKPVLQLGASSELLWCFERCHALARLSAAGRQASLATLALHMLTLLRPATPAGGMQRELSGAIQIAQQRLLERCSERVNMEQLARELHVSYSSFRHGFRARTGLSPKQFHLRMRLQKAQEFLANTGKTVKEIADILGFDSAFHLSAQFKAYTGLAPLRWRKRFLRLPGRSAAGSSD